MNMEIYLENNYGYEKHLVVSSGYVNENPTAEYCGTDCKKGVCYDCYLVVGDTSCYIPVCVPVKVGV